MKITIIGAGLTGLIAANMLRRFAPTIIEASPVLPSNHSAVLRFRSPAVQDATGVPFQRETVCKMAYDDEQECLTTQPTISIANKYSLKVTGAIVNRSIWNLGHCERWIAPVDFPHTLAKGIHRIEFSTPFAFSGLKEKPAGPDEVIISTIPMPMMMEALGYPMPKFDFRPIHVLNARVNIPSKVSQTIYFPGDDTPVYRATLTGDRVIIESSKHFPSGVPCQVAIAGNVLGYFGVRVKAGSLDQVRVTQQRIGKMLPIDNKVRQAFIRYLTEQFGVYSLGRYATWRNILLDDIVQDVRVIETLMTGSSYQRELHFTSNQTQS